MPTILIFFGLRFYFYTRDHAPIHVHVQGSRGNAKFEIESETRMIYNYGLTIKEVKLSENIIDENRELFINEWKKVFGG